MKFPPFGRTAGAKKKGLITVHKPFFAFSLSPYFKHNPLFVCGVLGVYGNHRNQLWAWWRRKSKRRQEKQKVAACENAWGRRCSFSFDQKRRRHLLEELGRDVVLYILSQRSRQLLGRIVSQRWWPSPWICPSLLPLLRLLAGFVSFSSSFLLWLCCGLLFSSFGGGDRHHQQQRDRLTREYFAESIGVSLTSSLLQRVLRTVCNRPITLTSELT